MNFFKERFGKQKTLQDVMQPIDNIVETHEYPMVNPDGSFNKDFQILDRPPTEDERLRFQNRIDKGIFVIKGNDVLCMRPTNSGPMCVGSINPENGWVISDMPYSRAGGQVLWIAREIANWEDPSGKLGPQIKSKSIQTGH